MTKQPNKSSRVRKNFRFPPDLTLWVEKYAEAKNTSMTQLIIDYFTSLREKENGNG